MSSSQPFIGPYGHRVNAEVALETINRKIEVEHTLFGDVIREMLVLDQNARPTIEMVLSKYGELFTPEKDDSALTTPASAPSTPLFVTIPSPLVGHLEASDSPQSRRGPSPLPLDKLSSDEEELELVTSDDDE